MRRAKQLIVYAIQLPTIPFVLLGLLLIGLGKVGEWLYSVCEGIQEIIVNAMTTDLDRKRNREEAMNRYFPGRGTKP